MHLAPHTSLPTPVERDARVVEVVPDGLDAHVGDGDAVGQATGSVAHLRREGGVRGTREVWEVWEVWEV